MEGTERADEPQVVLDVVAIQNILPHRYPFLLVDRIIELEPMQRVVGIKNVTVNEPFFAGHFPGQPIMPGVLILEAMAQTGGMMLLDSVTGHKDKLVYFTGIEKAKFRKPVVPGDQLRFEVELLKTRRAIFWMKGKALVDGKLACEAQVSAAIMDR
ncbi:MAG: 3-hydroxyacyl-ACP dehydratase FabZ [bacterium]